ncbi:MAG: hypothetical protein WAU65_03105 [Candidatus Nanoarchaeia archaeon]
MKQFLFLYPTPEYIDSEISKGTCGFHSKKEAKFLSRLKKAKSEEEKKRIRLEAANVIESEFETVYKRNLNDCIDARYRKNGFGINYLTFDNSPISDIIELQKSDKIIENGVDFKTFTKPKPDGSYPYPDSDYILDQLEKISELRVAGFHMWDCVERVAKRAYQRGLDTLVDEDLTEFFIGRLKDPKFDVKKYPTYDPKESPELFDLFIKARAGRPWLFQNY